CATDSLGRGIDSW
nr:immunoglobulin heavy chain junction region [Macaca mulatta]MOW50755.1 immunoglobulin heavy chain junction region [Macaca mulatta]